MFKMRQIKEHPVKAATAIIVASFAAIAWIYGTGVKYDTLKFVSVTYDSVVELLTPILLLALFVERTLEVFVASGRKLERAGIDLELASAKLKRAQLDKEVEKLTQLMAADEFAKQEEEARRKIIERCKEITEKEVGKADTAVNEAEGKVDEYRSETRVITFAFGTALGILIALAGVRAVGPLVDYQPANWSTLQLILFHGIDVVLTGALLAGGASGFSQVLTVFSEMTEKMRRRAMSDS